jgi:hypothetical protein
VLQTGFSRALQLLHIDAFARGCIFEPAAAARGPQDQMCIAVTQVPHFLEPAAQGTAAPPASTEAPLRGWLNNWCNAELLPQWYPHCP